MPEFQITCVETCRHFYSIKAPTLSQAKAMLDQDGTQPTDSEFMFRKIERVMRDVPIASKPRKKRAAKAEAPGPAPAVPAKKRGRKPGSKNKAKANDPLSGITPVVERSQEPPSDIPF